MTAKVVLNPYSNRWNAQKRWPDAEAALKSAGVDFDLAISQRKGHIIELVEQAVRDNFSPIIVAGGDGSLGEAVNGLARAAKSKTEVVGPLGIMPIGSANDLAKLLPHSTYNVVPGDHNHASGTAEFSKAVIAFLKNNNY